MDLTTAADVLKFAATFDRRSVAPDDIAIWSATLGKYRITRDEACSAISEHHETRPDDYLHIGHVIQIVRRRRSERVAQSAALEARRVEAIPPDVSDGEYVQLYRDAITQARAEAAAGASERLAALPAGERYRRRRSRADREHRRRAREHMTRQIEARGLGGRMQRDTEGLSPAVAAARERARAERGKHQTGGNDE